MIARLWRGQAIAQNADAYRKHATQHVFPALTRISGHRGAYLFTREINGQVEFLAITLWDSIDSIKKFAGENPEIAVVEPEARAVLSTFDDFVHHYEVEAGATC